MKKFWRQYNQNFRWQVKFFKFYLAFLINLIQIECIPNRQKGDFYADFVHVFSYRFNRFSHAKI